MANTEIALIQKAVELELTNKETVGTLLATTFKGLQVDVMKRALVEGMMRGFSFKDFLEKNIYAIPFAGGYSLVTSIDNARKIGMRSGVVGKSAPHFEEEGDKIISCEITVKRRVGQDIGEFTALVFFDEYFKKGPAGKPSLWETKPRTMIAKVAEMHAYRMACPEETSQMYLEEEMTRDAAPTITLDMESLANKVRSVTSEAELKTVWSLLPIEAKQELKEIKNEMKDKLVPATPPPVEDHIEKVLDEMVDEIVKDVEMTKEEKDQILADEAKINPAQ